MAGTQDKHDVLSAKIADQAFRVAVRREQIGPAEAKEAYDFALEYARFLLRRGDIGADDLAREVIQSTGEIYSPRVS